MSVRRERAGRDRVSTLLHGSSSHFPTASSISFQGASCMEFERRTIPSFFAILLALWLWPFGVGRMSSMRAGSLLRMIAPRGA